VRLLAPLRFAISAVTDPQANPAVEKFGMSPSRQMLLLCDLKDTGYTSAAGREPRHDLQASALRHGFTGPSTSTSP
jgi:hypothetical protein